MKNVLMIAPQFYGYETAIINHLEKIGYNVVFVNPNIDEINIPLKIIYKYIKRFNFLIDKLYYALKVKNVRNQVDEVFVIYTHYITESIMEKIKKEYSLCRYILYFWDSVDNNPTSLLLTKYFDKILTFDPRDSKKYGWIYRPLFYIDDYLVNNDERKIDVSFIGSVHSDRISISNKLRCLAKKKNLSCFIALYSKKLFFYLKKYIVKSSIYNKANAENFTFRKLNLKETYHIYGKSKIVLDYVYPNQIGLTMRTIEALGSGCLLVTNNINIKEEEIYDPKIIFVYEDGNLEIPEDFLRYKGRRNALIPYNYSLNSWIEEVFL